MAHKIAEAILENGQIKHVNKKLPGGRMKVHLIYDVVGQRFSAVEISKRVEGTSGIYKDVDVERESKKLRAEWERDVRS
jgi:hypothetical protein